MRSKEHGNVKTTCALRGSSSSHGALVELIKPRPTKAISLKTNRNQKLHDMSMNPNVFVPLFYVLKLLRIHFQHLKWGSRVLQAIYCNKCTILLKFIHKVFLEGTKHVQHDFQFFLLRKNRRPIDFWNKPKLLTIEIHRKENIICILKVKSYTKNIDLYLKW